MHYSRFGQWEESPVLVLETLPLDMPVSRSTAKPVFPGALYVLKEHLKHFVVAPDSIVLVVATQFQAELLVLFLDMQVMVVFAPIPN